MVFRKILTHKWPLAISLILIVSLYLWLIKEHEQLKSIQFVLGWILTFLAFLMSSYKLKRYLSVLPLGSNAAWHLFHLYGGFWCSVLFLLHAGWHLPSSPINQALWIGFVLILLSGIFGFILTKIIAPLVSGSGERLIYERIPGHISLTRERSQLLILKAAASTSGKPLTDYYHQHLMAFFNHAGHLGFKLLTHKKRFTRYMVEMDELVRYLDTENQQHLHEMQKLLKQKSMMDWQYSTLSLLRQWTLLHVPLIWFTLIILLVHIMIQYAFMVRSLW